jgi:hypothetical protein
MEEMKICPSTCPNGMGSLRANFALQNLEAGGVEQFIGTGYELFSFVFNPELSTTPIIPTPTGTPLEREFLLSD